MLRSRHGSFMRLVPLRQAAPIRERSPGRVKAIDASMTRRAAPKLFQNTFLREGRRMLFIAAGLFLALVTADLLDLSVRKTSGTDRAKLGS